MRRALTRLTLTSLVFSLALAGCGGGGPRDSAFPSSPEQDAPSSTDAAADLSTESRSSAPNIGVTAAPGVAFNYRHAFALPAERIADVQERHAQACETLGVSRCRITGMSYRRRNEHEIEGSLQFKLDPALARRFGQVGLETVEQEGGLLIESDISGTDVGSGIRTNDRNIAQLREDLQRIEQQIADPRVPASQKQGLRAQAEDLRQRIRAIEANRVDQQESLATTPVTFAYGTDESVGDRPNWSRTLRNAWDGFIWGLHGLFLLLVTLLPWIVIGTLLWLLLRWVRRRFARADGPETAHQPVTQIADE